MKKKILLLFLVLMSTALTMSGQNSVQKLVTYNGFPDPTDNSVTIVPTANAGDEVQVNINTPSGYVLDDIMVWETNNNTYTDVYICNALCCFKMPSDDVVVYVNYMPCGNTSNPVNVSPFIRHGRVRPSPSASPPNNRVRLTLSPDAGFSIGKVTANLFSGFFRGGQSYATTIEPISSGSHTYNFTMPDRPVDVYATFIPDPTTPSYLLAVANYHTTEMSYMTVEINGELRIPNSFDFTYAYYDVYYNDYIVVTNYPRPGYWTTYFWVSSTYGSYYFNDCWLSNTFSFDMPDLDCTLDFETRHAPYKINIEPSANGWVKTYDDWYYSDAGEPVYLDVNPNWGYELDNIIVKDRNNLSLQVDPVNGKRYKFTMPRSDVWVYTTFRKKTYTITLDPNSNGTLQAKNYTTNFSATNNMYPYNTLNAQIGDEIKLSHAIFGSNLEFVYYIIKKTSDGSVIGVTNEDFSRFTMPPCDLTISAYFASPPVMVVVLTPLQFARSEPFINTIGEVIGIIYLHERTDLEDPSKSRSFTGWDDEENYGWSTAVPGEPMYFTVVPEAGYQVKKSDINVKLLAVSENEDGEVVVLEDCVVQEGFDISGPDDYVTEPTDFSFIFDVPEGYNPSTVQVAFDATFTPVDYNITVNPGIEHGTVIAPATARMDELVRFNVIPEPGYRLTGITVTSETSGLFVDVVGSQFTMPACNVLVTAEFEESAFLRGDVDNDGFISISDVTVLIDYILSGDESMVSLEGADCDQDGSVNISDVTLLIDYILSGDW